MKTLIYEKSANAIVSVLVPVVRLQNVENLHEEILRKHGFEFGLVNILMFQDDEKIGCPLMLKKMVDMVETEYVCFIGDDCIPEKDFLKIAFKTGYEAKTKTNSKHFPLVGLNDGYNSGEESATHFFANKSILQYLEGEFFHTGYRHCFCDNELVDRMKELDLYVFAKEAKLHHNNPIVESRGNVNIESLEDENYKRAYSPENYHFDKMLYLERKLKRFRNGGGRKVAVAFPIIDDRVYSQFFISFAIMEKPNFVLLFPQFPTGDFPKDIASVRNNLVTQALIMNCTHIVFMDTDQVYPRNTLTALLSSLEIENFGVLGARVHRRYVPFDPILLRGLDWKFSHVGDEESLSGKIVEVDATGTGCLAVDTDVFFKVPFPWFKIVRNPNTGGPIGEDVYFTVNAKKAGFKVGVHTGIEVKHLALIEVNQSLYRLYKKSTGFAWNETENIQTERTINQRLLDESFSLSFATNNVD